MKLRLWVSVLLLITIVAISGCRRNAEAPKADPLLSAYDTELDWTDAQKIIPLSYQQSQGKRIFYQQCVWCHADALRQNAFIGRNSLCDCPHARRSPAAVSASRPPSVTIFGKIGDTRFA